MIKTNGSEYKRFYDDETAWSDGAWHEDELLLVNGDKCEAGIDSIPDNATVNLIGGVVYDLPNRSTVSMETHFRNWRKRQSMTTILVECDQAKLDDIKVAVKSAGGKVL